jgi:hypothetical protein
MIPVTLDAHLEFVDAPVVGEKEEHSHLVKNSLHRLRCLNIDSSHPSN